MVSQQSLVIGGQNRVRSLDVPRNRHLARTLRLVQMRNRLHDQLHTERDKKLITLLKKGHLNLVER